MKIDKINLNKIKKIEPISPVLPVKGNANNEKGHCPKFKEIFEEKKKTK